MQRFKLGGAKLLIAVITAILPASLSADIIVFQGDNPPFGAFLDNANFNNNDTGVIVTGTVAGKDVNVTNGATVLTVQGQQIQADAGGTFNFATLQTDPGFIFTILSFNLDVSADGMVTFSTAPSAIPPFPDTFAVDANGENRFTLYALGAQTLSSVTMSLDTGGILDIKQIRAGIRAAGTINPLGDPVVPEPSTWVLMSAGVACLLVRRRMS
jgi:hypothetical protein